MSEKDLIQAIHDLTAAVEEIGVTLRVQAASKSQDNPGSMDHIINTYRAVMVAAPEPPSWFEPEGVGPKPEPPAEPHGVNVQVMMAVKSKGLFTDLDGLIEFVEQSQRLSQETRGRLVRWCGEVQAYHEALHEWEMAYQRARLGQWPSAYAALVMAGTARQGQSSVQRSGTG